MGGLICFFQLFKCGVGINLGGGEALVSQQLLHRLKSCTVVEHGGGEGMAKHMWTFLLEGTDPG